jgi:kynurenine formamidase
MKRMRRGSTVLLAAGLLVSAPALLSSQVTESRYGKDDRLGAINEVTPAKSKRAAALIRQGKTYDLAMDLESGAPAFPPRYFNHSLVYNRVHEGLGSNDFRWSEEIITGYLGTFTQVDCLGHPGIGEKFYGGRNWNDIAGQSELEELSCENLPPTMTRGVLLDVAALKGQEVLPAGYEITAADLQAAMKRQGISKIEPGDVVLIHTGWMKNYRDNPQAWIAGEPGIDRDAAQWLATLRPMAVGADTWGVDVWPNKGSEAFAAHQVLTTQNGILLLENVVTAELARDKANEFAFTLSFLPVKGAGQTWGTFTAHR